MLTTVTSQAVEHFRYHTPRSYLEKIEETKSINHEPSMSIVGNLFLFLFFLLALLLIALLLVLLVLILLVLLLVLVLVLILVVIILWLGILVKGFFVKENPQKVYIRIFTQGYIKIIME